MITCIFTHFSPFSSSIWTVVGRKDRFPSNALSIFTSVILLCSLSLKFDNSSTSRQIETRSNPPYLSSRLLKQKGEERKKKKALQSVVRKIKGLQDVQSQEAPLLTFAIKPWIEQHYIAHSGQTLLWTVFVPRTSAIVQIW